MSLFDTRIIPCPSLVGSKLAYGDGQTIIVSPAMYDLLPHATEGELERLLATIQVKRFPATECLRPLSLSDLGMRFTQLTEPTRDPRLLSAERLSRLRRWNDQCGQSLGDAEVDELLAHIAAQDQRHAALVAAATEALESMEAKVWRMNQDRQKHMPEWELGDTFVRLKRALAALAQPPGDESRG
jgi:hypothetical protein